MAANRFKAAGQKKVSWETTTAEGTLITEEKTRKASKPKRNFRSAARAIIAANRFGSFGGGGVGSSFAPLPKQCHIGLPRLFLSRAFSLADV